MPRIIDCGSCSPEAVTESAQTPALDRSVLIRTVGVENILLRECIFWQKLYKEQDT